MKFLIVSIKYKRIFKIVASALFIIIYLSTFMDFQYKMPLLLFLLIVAIFFVVLAYKFYHVTLAGEIKFEEENILVYNIQHEVLQQIPFAAVEEIKLEYDAFTGEISNKSGIYQFMPSKGGDNLIKITTSANLYKYNLYLETQTDAIRFKMLYRLLQENDIKTTMKGYKE